MILGSIFAAVLTVIIMCTYLNTLHEKTVVIVGLIIFYFCLDICLYFSFESWFKNIKYEQSINKLK